MPKAIESSTSRFRLLRGPPQCRYGRQRLAEGSLGHSIPLDNSSAAENEDGLNGTTAGTIASSSPSSAFANESNVQSGPSTHRLDENLEEGDAGAERMRLLALVERLKRQVQARKNSVERIKDELEAAKQQCAELQQELEEKESSLKRVRESESQYRNWWLNEIQFTKLLLNKVPNPNRDMDLVRTSQAHYVGHY
ncbi:hypothetical protein BKA70DRAFT_1227049 [Coprinopsis sp. MPI-PUGE-AT-0042]|nr:hypothetical protein BKA70DRAFT_1227049 [Coprinopsis sp. MPI-PUGE-AT-0042]